MASAEVHPLQVALGREEVLRFLGYPQGASPRPDITCLLDEVISEARTLIEARGLFRLWPVSRAGEVGLQPVEAESLALGLVTVGQALERRATRHLETGEVTRALILDAAGSAAAEEAADRLGGVIAGDSDQAKEGTVSCRISPGYGKWSLEAQPALFRALPHADLGVTLLSSLLMVPRKSVSFAMWLGAEARPVGGSAGCSRCPLTGCLYRREEAR